MDSLSGLSGSQAEGAYQGRPEFLETRLTAPCLLWSRSSMPLRTAPFALLTLAAFACGGGPDNTPTHRGESPLETGEPPMDSLTAQRLNRAHNSSLLRPLARAEASALAARLGDDLIVHTSTTDPSLVVSTASGDLLPPHCRPSASDPTPNFELAARCFLEAHTNLMLDADPSDRGEPVNLVLIANDPGGELAGGEQYLRFEQRHRGIVVEDRTIALAFTNRRLTTLAGRYAGTAGFIDPDGLDIETLMRVARARWGAAIESGGLIYDAASGRIELLVHHGISEYRLDADTGVFLRTESRGHAQFAVMKTAGSYVYPSSEYLGLSDVTQNWTMSANCAGWPPGVCDFAGTGSCFYMPVPNISQPDPHDKVHELNVTYAGYPETAVSVVRPCGSTNVFTTLPFSSLFNLEHYALSARRTVDDLSNVLNHSESFFWVYPRTPYSLRVNVNQTLGQPGLYTSHDQKINLRQDPSPYGNQEAIYFDTIAHEYGHYIHHSYGFYGSAHVDEASASG